MMTAAGTIRCPEKKMKKPRPLPDDRYLYISGLVKARELQLLDQIQLSRLLEAGSGAEIARLLAECGYHAAKTPQEMLARESAALLEWLRDDLPDASLAQVLLPFNDIHNLTLVLKLLLQVWLAAESGQDPAKNPQAAAENKKNQSVLASFSRLEITPSLAQVQELAAQPAQVEAGILFQGLAENDLADLPEWIQQAALAAIERYMARYDLGDLETCLDQLAWRRAHDLACQTGSIFLVRYLQYKTDIINLEMLLRTRLLQSNGESLARSLLPGGLVAEKTVASLYTATAEKINQAYAGTPFTALARLAEQYEKPGQAAQFALLADYLLLSHNRSAMQASSGPQVPLAYVLARQLEIKNVRIVLTCLENKVPRAKMRELVRDSYLAWR